MALGVAVAGVGGGVVVELGGGVVVELGGGVVVELDGGVVVGVGLGLTVGLVPPDGGATDGDGDGEPPCIVLEGGRPPIKSSRFLLMASSRA